MKEKALHIGVAVLGFIVMIQGVSAQTLPESDYLSQLVQIDAEEISKGDDSKIRFSDTDRVLPAIEAAPTQQSMSSTMASAEELSLEEQMVQRMNEQRREQRRERMRRNQERQDERNQYQDQNERERNDQRNQNNQNRNQQDRNNQRDQNQYDQNRDQQNRNQNNQGGQNRNGTGTCPNPDDERCFYPESQRERCELFGGTYSNGRCSMENSNWYLDREECEELGGYYTNGRCEMDEEGWNAERQRCEDQGGVYRDGQCSMGNNGGNQNRSNEYGDRQRCEIRGGEYINGTCSFDQDRQNRPYDRNKQNNQSSFQGEEDDVMVSLNMIARTEKRKACEKKGGEYLGEGKCAFNYDQRTCERQEGIYRNEECIIDTDDL